MLKSINPKSTESWNLLLAHFAKTKNQHMKDLFQSDEKRFDKFSIQWNGFLIDYSKNRISEETLSLLFGLARECNLKDSINSMFEGDKINVTENRAVLHTALRNFENKPFMLDGTDIKKEIQLERERMKSFVQALHTGKFLGHSGKKLKQIVNIGIGGSDLGPLMVTEALKPYWIEGIDTHYVSNVDAAHIHETLKKINHEEVLFMVASKSFTTQETMANARAAKDWLINKYSGDENAIANHFIALSTNKVEVENFGINPKNIFGFWNWVGGRYSLWSSIGMSIACTIGFENFELLLKGAEDMDKHFKSSEFEKNIPVILALIGIWYNNFYECETEAILPYSQYLHQFPAYMQQANMESNGKSINRIGEHFDYQSGPIVWGEPGTNGQHAFYQLLHQGTKLVPCDFIGFVKPAHKNSEMHDMLMANLFAQSEALMLGKEEKTVMEELKHLDEEKRNKLIPFKTFPGNIPSNTILAKELNPRNLGSLIALYEHKIFVQGVIWNIFSYDQWGVELGKQLANNILLDFNSNTEVKSHLSSSNGLINAYLKTKNE